VLSANPMEPVDGKDRSGPAPCRKVMDKTDKNGQ